MLFQKITVAKWLVCLTLCYAATVAAYSDKKQTVQCLDQQYVFSWSMTDRCAMEPRGGTSAGVPVELAKTKSQQWQALQEQGLSKFERDRRAILAMAGGYRASFEFLETVGFSEDFAPSRPYQSWGTEYVYVVEDNNTFISLQHILVMFFQQGDKVSEPVVMKHWRQDWQYEDREILEYTGKLGWHTRKLSKKDVKGTWSQSVFQVDDSPRYSSYGPWMHKSHFSSWQSGTTWRPLPRREHSVRKDYDVLEGTNRHTILPSGWVHEEENLKLSLDEKAQPLAYIAKELGNNRYELIKNFDFSAADKYWGDTSAYWKIVRQSWNELFAKKARFVLHTKKDDTLLFMLLFDLAEQFKNGKIAEEDVKAKVDDILENYWENKD